MNMFEFDDDAELWEVRAIPFPSLLFWCVPDPNAFWQLRRLHKF